MIINTLYELDYQNEMSDSNKLLLRWREEEDGQWARKQKVVENYEPYCYVPLKGERTNFSKGQSVHQSHFRPNTRPQKYKLDGRKT